MPRMQATLIHGRHAGQDTYEFDIDENMLEETPIRIMRKFMEYMDEAAHLGHLDYEINAAMKDDDNVISAIGAILFSATNRQPFTCLISPK